MRYIIFCSMLSILFAISSSCKTDDDKKGARNAEMKQEVPANIENSDFKKMLAGFKHLEYSELNSLEQLFYNEYDEFNSLDFKGRLDKNFATQYFSHLAHLDRLSRGFIIECPNDFLILTVIGEYGNGISSEGILDDTTYLVANVFDGDYNLLGHFDLCATNLTGIPPTYNVLSKFEFDQNRWTIYITELCTGDAYDQIEPISTDPLLYIGRVWEKKVIIDFQKGKVIKSEAVMSTKPIEEYYPKDDFVRLRVAK